MRVEAPRGEAAPPGFAQLLAIIRCARPPTAMILAAILISFLEIAATLWFPILTKELIDGIPTMNVGSAALIANSRVQLLLAMLVVGAIAGGMIVDFGGAPFPIGGRLPRDGSDRAGAPRSQGASLALAGGAAALLRSAPAGETTRRWQPTNPNAR